MKRQLTVKQKMNLGFALMTALCAAVAVVGAFAIRGAIRAKDEVIEGDLANLLDLQKLRTALEERVAAARGFLLTSDELYVALEKQADDDVDVVLARIAAEAGDEAGRAGVAEIARRQEAVQQVTEAMIALRRTGASTDDIARQYEARVTPEVGELARVVTGYAAAEEHSGQVAERAANDRATAAVAWLLGLAGVACVLATAMALLLGRGITRQIGTAVRSVESSSAELQAAANQQAAGSKEQTTAMTEVVTTLKELVATSRQMAESSQRVTRIAENTGGAAQAGDQTVQKAQGSIAAIKRQVDLIVTHMLDLGKKSQHVGGILEIINELAEQTNILAINASIESAGAGEAGKRFAVVADEIRRLADRVGGSTKEIRGLIEEIRSSTNTTVMVTEDGLKAVDAGSRQFGDVTAAFRQIAGMVETTTEAAREIELGTKQQVTAIEQVNAALADINQAARESESSTRQTLQTSSELAKLSRQLGELIRRGAMQPSA